MRTLHVVLSRQKASHVAAVENTMRLSAARLSAVKGRLYGKVGW